MVEIYCKFNLLFFFRKQLTLNKDFSLWFVFRKKKTTKYDTEFCLGGNPDVSSKWMLPYAHLLLIPPFARKEMESKAQTRTAVHACPLDSFLTSSNLMKGTDFGLFLYFPFFTCRQQDK